MHLFFLSLSGPFAFLWGKVKDILIPIMARWTISRWNFNTRKRIFYTTILGTQLVVKKTSKLGIGEAETTRFVARHTSIPVPKLYTYWTQVRRREGKDDLVIIVMERMPGQSLFPVWYKLKDSQKAHIFEQLRPYLAELRALPQPDPVGHIGPLHDGRCIDYRISNDPFGPFPDEKAFNDWRISTHDWQAKRSERVAVRLRQIRAVMRDNHNIVFTHSDLQPHNVQVDIRGESPEDAHVVGLLDWEMSGWMPEYWEAVKMMHGQSDNPDWRQMVVELFPGYESELAWEAELHEISGRTG